MERAREDARRGAKQPEQPTVTPSVRAVVGRVRWSVVDPSWASRVRLWDRARWRATTTSASGILCCWTRLRSTAWWRISGRGTWLRSSPRMPARIRDAKWQANGEESVARARVDARVPFADNRETPRTVRRGARERVWSVCVSAGVRDSARKVLILIRLL